MIEDARPSPYSPDQLRALTAVLDTIIPPDGDGRLPGAGEIGVADTIAQRAPELAPVVVHGLALLDELAGACGFAELTGADRAAALNEASLQDPGFLPGLIFHTYAAYYQNGRVLEALGLEPRPPHPKGYDLEDGDFTLLDEVRRRPKLYREV